MGYRDRLLEGLPRILNPKTPETTRAPSEDIAEAERAALEAQDEPEPDDWPKLPRAALHGLAGDVVRGIHPYTEADPNAILTHFLVFFGNCVGASPHFRIGGSRHPAKLFAALIGDSSTGRKGTAERDTRQLFEAVDPTWARKSIRHGMASGEGLIRAFDPLDSDGHPEESRLMMVEHEMVNTLKAMSRDGSTLSGTIRNAWDSDDLEIGRSSKKNSIRVHGAHVSMVTHVTRGELLRSMDSSQNSNGFANRFLWIMVKRSKLLPDAPQVPKTLFDELGRRTSKAASFASDAGEMLRDPDAAQMWRDGYAALSEISPGLTGLVTSRAASQVLRLSMIYALLDSSRVISPTHLKAALAFWSFTTECAARIFGGRYGDPIAQRIISELSEAENHELSRTELYEALGRNLSGVVISSALALLTENKDAEVYRRDKAPGERGPRLEIVRLLDRPGRK